MGINTFDTAEGYENGASEVVLGKALLGKRDKAVVATKVSAENLKPDDLRRSCEHSLKRLQSDYIDLYQIHWPNHNISLAETIGSLKTLKGEGKIREYGVCNFGPKDFADMKEVSTICVNQLSYSLIFRAIEFEIRDMCIRNNVAIMAYAPLFQGLVTGKFKSADEVPCGRARSRHFSKNRPLTRHGKEGHEEETFRVIDELRKVSEELNIPMSLVALAWVKEQPGITTTLVGARSPEQIRQNIRAAEYCLPKEAVEKLTAVSERLKQEMGPNADTHQGESRFR